MHDHNKDGGHKGMMWMMVLCCALLLAALFFAGSGFSSGEYLWPIIIGIFVIAHIWMMFKGHGEHRNTDDNKKSDITSSKQSGEKNDHQHGGSCH